MIHSMLQFYIDIDDDCQRGGGGSLPGGRNEGGGVGLIPGGGERGAGLNRFNKDTGRRRGGARNIYI